MKLSDTKVLLTGFRIISHAFIKETEDQKFIALDDSNDLRLVDTKSSNTEDFPRLDTKEFGDRIVNVISQAFNNKNGTIIFTVKTNKGFSNHFGDFNSKKHHQIFDSDSTPMLVADPVTLEPLLIYTHNKMLHIGKIKNEKYEGVKSMPFDHLPKGIHTSDFIDLTNDMKAELILHVKEQDKNGILISKLAAKDKEYDIEKIQYVGLPETTGPILFTEMVDPLSTDMIFVSKEGNTFFLNLYKNLSLENKAMPSLKDFDKVEKFYLENKTSEVFNQSSPRNIKFNLTQALNGAEPVIRAENDVPCGIFLADISGKGVKDVFLLSKKIDGTVNINVFKYTDSNPESLTFELDKDLTESFLAFKNVDALTVFEGENSSIENLLISTVNHNLPSREYTLSMIEIDQKLEKNGINLLPTVYINEDKTQPFIPGTSFLMVYENQDKVRKVNLSSQSSFPSLQRHKCLVGLNGTNLFINNLLLKVPSPNLEKNQYNPSTFLVPNTSAIFTHRDKEWKIQCFFSKRYYMMTFISVFVVLVIFSTIYMILSVQDKKRYKSVMDRDSMRRIFNAL